MQVRVRGLGSHARHARNRLARATPRPTGGDGDGPLADGRTPVECRAHCASSTGRQRRLALVEPVGRGGTNGEGVTLRPPFTPRILPHRRHSRCLFSPLPLLPPQLLPLISSSPEYYHFGGGKRRGKRNPPRLRWTARRRHRLPSMVVADQHPLGDGSERRSYR